LIKDPMDSIVNSQSMDSYKKFCLPEGDGSGSSSEIKTGELIESQETANVPLSSREAEEEKKKNWWKFW
ncbi:MAG: hypothetical protein HQ594_05340, partial [Candidatus Omnitrophica bacterium]|nr:hypothetical protein [Candidatus Omnitrophota bacterium]